MKGPLASYTPYNFEQLSVTDSPVVTPTASKLRPTGVAYQCDRLTVSVDTSDIYYTIDGTAPTTDKGIYAAKNLPAFHLYGAEAMNFKCLRVGSNSGRVSLTFSFATN